MYVPLSPTRSPTLSSQDVPESCVDKDVYNACPDYNITKIKWLCKEGWTGKGFIQFDTPEAAEAVSKTV